MRRNFEETDFDWLLVKHGTCTFLLIQALIDSFPKKVSKYCPENPSRQRAGIAKKLFDNFIVGNCNQF